MAFFEKRELKTLWPFYLEILVSTIFFILPPFYVIYLQGIGLSITKIGILLSLSCLITLIFDVPTSAIADLWGRKRVVVLGYSLAAIALSSIAFTKDYLIIFALYMLWTLGMTLTSGAYESWIVDNLKFNKESKLIKNFYVHKQIFMNSGFVLAGLIAAFLVNAAGMSIIWVISSISFLISAGILIFVKEHKLSHPKRNFSSFVNQNKDSLKYSWKHKIIFFILIAAFTTSLSWMLHSDLLLNPLMKQRGIPISWLGYLFSLSSLIGVFAPLIAKKALRKKGRESNFLAYLLIIDGLIVMSAIFTISWIPIALIYLATLAVTDIRMPLVGNLLQRNIPSKKRATLTSINFMAVTVGVIIGGPLAGLLADHSSFELTLVVGGIISIITALFYTKIKNK